ncbi:HNH endonuclease signature motif containing protein [Mycetocola zhadangensis]|uniref:HNH endonuclease n=1 Tax=Mycetocola zhadangensis TaxID=1164595 RepID=A0A3L7J6N1_9MICO|nr:HNH endonuclease signature motif containing protein [Mycetocola zhadangensis]RLQ86119.1 HNH endonuclease [Mycetocola zhadangensis]GGE88533.1 HNH endonuclease [Mycetocola zhadangensis]
MNTSVAVLPVTDDAEIVALGDVLHHLSEVLETLDLDHLDRLTSDTVLSVVAQAAALGRGVETVLVAASQEVAVRSDAVLGGEGLAARMNYPRASFLIEQVAGVSSATASRLIRVGSRTNTRVTVGQTLPPLFPHVAEAFRAGMISVETADVITRELTLAAPRADVAHLEVAEQTLVGQAAGTTDQHGLPLPTDLVAMQARAWRDRLDEKGIEPRAEKAFNNRDFWMSRTAKDGLIRFGGHVTIDVGAKLHALMDAILSSRTQPRFVDENADDTIDFPVAEMLGANEPVDDPVGLAGTGQGGLVRTESGRAGKVRDTRSAGQQRADVFAAMIDALARSAEVPTVSGAAPTVVVRVSADVLERRSGTADVVGISDPLPYSAVQQILCDSDVVPAYLDPGGGVVALGTTKRAFHRGQRMAMIARDGPTCAMPGCQIPATGCEGHHVVRHSEGGPTSVDNGVLLCWFHHHMVDADIFTITMENGTPVFTIPDWLLRKPYFR